MNRENTMSMSAFFRALRNAYQSEMDDLTFDSEGRDVLKKRLLEKRSQMGFLSQMMETNPEMVAVVFHGGFHFELPAVMEQLLTLESDEFPDWDSLADAVHEVGGLMVLDCVASGAIWVNMEATGVDVLVTAPQKGWSGSPCCAMVCLSPLARTAIDGTSSSSYACDLKKWLQIMESYEAGGHMYHATMPTDALVRLREVMQETRAYGFEKVRVEQLALGAAVRELFEGRGIPSVAAEGFKAPGVVVSYTTDPDIQNSKKFLALGLQTAAGVPLQCDEPADFMSFRVGLFGLEKLHNPARSVAQLAAALDAMR